MRERERIEAPSEGSALARASNSERHSVRLARVAALPNRKITLGWGHQQDAHGNVGAERIGVGRRRREKGRENGVRVYFSPLWALCSSHLRSSWRRLPCLPCWVETIWRRKIRFLFTETLFILITSNTLYFCRLSLYFFVLRFGTNLLNEPLSRRRQCWTVVPSVPVPSSPVPFCPLHWSILFFVRSVRVSKTLRGMFHRVAGSPSFLGYQQHSLTTSTVHPKRS